MPVDMSPAAVTARLKRVSQLRRLCLSLAKAGKAAEEAGEAKKTGTASPKNPANPIPSKTDGPTEPR